MCSSHWFVNQLLLKAVLLKLSPSAGSKVWKSNRLALYIVLYTLLGESSDCKPHSNLLAVVEPHNLLILIVSEQSNREDCFFCQSFNFKHFYPFYLLISSCKHGLIARPFLQNTKATPTKIILKTCSAFLLLPPKSISKKAAAAVFPSQPQDPSPTLVRLPETLDFFISNSPAAIWWHSPLWITVYALSFQQWCYK